MTSDNKIWEAAEQALLELGGSADLPQILRHIIDNRLYDFGTQDPPHVLDTELKRKSVNSNRTDRSTDLRFKIIGDSQYSLLSGRGEEMKETTKASGTKRIHRAKDKEEIISLLMSDQVGVFKEIWRLLLFAAEVGIQEKRREPLNAVDSGKGIDQSTFGNCPSWPGVCYLAALVEQDSSDSLMGSSEAEDLRLTIFQEYSNGGLAVLQEHFQDRPIDLDSLLAFIDSRLTKRGKPADIEDLI